MSDYTSEALDMAIDAMTDKTPPKIPTAAELNAAGVSCWTCDKKTVYKAVSGVTLWCLKFDGATRDDDFCRQHPKLQGADRTKQRNP